MLTIILIAYASSSLALAVATGQNITSVANLLINICFVFMIVFSGILVNLTTIAPSLLWLEYFSIPRYGLNALQINEFTGLRFCNETPEGVNGICVSTTAFTVCTGEDYLEMQGIGTTAWDLWQNHVALIFMTIIFLTIAYLKLKFLKKYT
ncbi:ATP-binding cassette sub-family G member 2, partial [Ophiophagus hannah]